MSFARLSRSLLGLRLRALPTSTAAPRTAPIVVRVPPLQRNLTVSAVRAHNELTPPAPGEESVAPASPVRVWLLTTTSDRLNVTFIDKDRTPHTFQVAAGDNLLDIAQANDLEMEGKSGLEG